MQPEHAISATLPAAMRAARVHEAGGRGAWAYALWQASLHKGTVCWVHSRSQPLNLAAAELPIGLHNRLIFVEVASEDDLLWAAEEALRAPPVGLVIAQPQKPLSLTTGRRLQLAAEAGQTTGLLLIREGQGSNAAETRWRCEAVAGEADSTLHHWQLIKNKMGTCGDWVVHWDGKTAACHMVSEVRE